MTFTPDEMTRIKNMLKFLVKRKSEESDGHCGFHVNELNPILDELSQEGEISRRETIQSSKYFFNH